MFSVSRTKAVRGLGTQERMRRGKLEKLRLILRGNKATVLFLQTDTLSTLTCHPWLPAPPHRNTHPSSAALVPAKCSRQRPGAQLLVFVDSGEAKSWKGVETTHPGGSTQATHRHGDEAQLFCGEWPWIGQLKERMWSPIQDQVLK